jgi:hypothetical protein
MADTFEYEFTGERLFDVGKQFPPESDIERLAKYKRGKLIFDGKHDEVYRRAKVLLDPNEQAEQLRTLYMAVNIVDILVTKPADMLFNEAPKYESGKASGSRQQKAVEEITRRNRLNLLGHELVTANGYRGDAFIKTYFDYMEDFSELPFIPKGVNMEAIIDSQDPSTVFPELSKGSKKKFKAVNIAYVEWVTNPVNGNETPYLNLERHMAGLIEYSRFRLMPQGPEGYDTRYGVGIPTFKIVERVSTGRESDLELTGVPKILVRHIPYKSTDDRWQGISLVENIEDLIAAINDRLVQIDYILFKHSDPNMYGPDLDDTSALNSGGKYIPVRKDEVAPAYMVWNSQLEGAFRELETLLSLVYQIAETPQWLFGTTIGNGGGTGTSHTDAASIKARFMPILSKVNRIKTHVDYAFKDAIEAAQYLENEGNAGVKGFASYDPVYPNIAWQSPLPKDEKALAEIMQIRTGGRPTLDVKSAIKYQDDVNDAAAEETMRRIEEDESKDATVETSIYNDETADIEIEEDIDEAGDE